VEVLLQADHPRPIQSCGENNLARPADVPLRLGSKRGTGTKFLITKFPFTEFLITKFLITNFLIDSAPHLTVPIVTIEFEKDSNGILRNLP
jgi:hypothetical protein